MVAGNRGLTFTPDIPAFIASRSGAPYTVLCGGNNSGKSLVMKNMRSGLGRHAHMAGPQRFYHVHELSTQRFNDRDYDNWYQQFRSESNNEEFNSEQNFIDLGRIIGGLKDVKRGKLFALCEELIGSKFSLQKRDPDNELSPRFVEMDDQNLAVGSTGTRLLMTLLGLCMDEQFESMLIDEPELGLSPRIQRILADFLADETRRKEYFPQLKRVVVATHSHLFLDRLNIGNNFVISKQGKNVSIRQVADMSELHDLQFNLLGNSLESLFLPSAFVIVEGKTDRPYVEKVLQNRYPGRNILTIDAQGDVKRAFNSLRAALGDIYKSPFRPRTFVVLDSVHTRGTKEELVQQGALTDNVVVWNRNGIEFLYPPSIVAGIFACGESEVGQLSIQNDEISLNGITRRKRELSDEVLRALRPSDALPEELETKLVRPMGAAIGS